MGIGSLELGGRHDCGLGHSFRGRSLGLFKVHQGGWRDGTMGFLGFLRRFDSRFYRHFFTSGAQKRDVGCRRGASSAFVCRLGFLAG